MAWKTEDGFWFKLEPETDEEARDLMSQTAILHRNINDNRHKKG